MKKAFFAIFVFDQSAQYEDLCRAKVLKMDNNSSCSETTNYETTPTVGPFCITGKVLQPYF